MPQVHIYDYKCLLNLRFHYPNFTRNFHTDLLGKPMKPQILLHCQVGLSPLLIPEWETPI